MACRVVLLFSTKQNGCHQRPRQNICVFKHLKARLSNNYLILPSILFPANKFVRGECRLSFWFCWRNQAQYWSEEEPSTRVNSRRWTFSHRRRDETTDQTIEKRSKGLGLVSR